MCEVKLLLNDLNQTFIKHREQRHVQMINIMNQMRCCDCGHKMRMRNMQKASKLANSCPYAANSLIPASFVLLLFLIIYWIYMARKYNVWSIFGSGGCTSTFFYTFTDCDVYI